MLEALLVYAWLVALAGVVSPNPGVKDRVIRILFVIDVALFSICTLGKAYPYESFSSAAWRSQCHGGIYGRIARPVIDAIFRVIFGQHEHCANAFYFAKLNLPPEQR